MKRSIVWHGSSSYFPTKFSFGGTKIEIDSLGYWQYNGVSYNGKPWVTDDGKLCGAIIDPKIKEEHERLENDPSILHWLDIVSKSENVAGYQYPSRPCLNRKTKPCTHISWSQMTKGYVCNDCTTFELKKPSNKNLIVIYSKNKN